MGQIGRRLAINKNATIEPQFRIVEKEIANVFEEKRFSSILEICAMEK